MRSILFLTAAFQAILTSAMRFETEDGIIDSETQIERFVKEHMNEPGFGTNPDNVTDVSIASRSLEGRATGSAIIANKCYYDVWVWSVDQNGSRKFKLPARSQKSEKFRKPCNGCGVSFKVSETTNLVAGKHTQFEYAIANNIIYFDISYVDCARGKDASNCPGHHKGHAINSSPSNLCGSFHCKGKTYCPRQAYYVPQPLKELGIPEPVKGCGNNGYGMKIYFKMCADNKSLKRTAGRIEYEDEGEEEEELAWVE